MSGLNQAGRSWQTFGDDTNGHQNFHQAPICYFRDKYAVFERNNNFANLIQYKMQYIPCISAHLAQETLFMTQKRPLLAQSPKSV